MVSGSFVIVLYKLQSLRYYSGDEDDNGAIGHLNKFPIVKEDFDCYMDRM